MSRDSRRESARPGEPSGSAQPSLPRDFHGSRHWFDRAIERIFATSWQVAGDAHLVREPGSLAPATFLGGALDEPILLTRDDEGRLRVLSNVCTHRGAILRDAPAKARTIRCPYHGRRFELDGTLRCAPGFALLPGGEGGPENLPRFEHAEWGPLLFTAIDPSEPFDAVTGETREMLAWYPWDRLMRDSGMRREYRVRAGWALYCENYLEGLHIPFVHGALAGKIDLQSYRATLMPHASVQIADARDPEEAFGAIAPEGARRSAAFYVFLFPNTMVNVYPWGVSLNVVVPVAHDETIVRYEGFVLDRDRLGRGAGGDLDRVELEDDAVVESCRRGVASRAYRPGQLSATEEICVSHFRSLAARALA